MSLSQITLQHQQSPSDFSFFTTRQEIDWSNMTDQELEAYENGLLSLYQSSIPQSLISQKLQEEQKASGSELLKSLRFKDLFFDSLEGNNHQILYFGSTRDPCIQSLLSTEIIKRLASILFKIGQQKKISYPHLLTHIKEQFYKPTIFNNLNLNENLKQKYYFLINTFFNETHQELIYDDFIKQNHEFQDICVMVLRKIASEDKKIKEPQCSDFQNINKSKSFKFIEKICTKFLIEINYLGFNQSSIEMLALGNEERFIFVKQQNNFFLIQLEKFQFLSVRRKSFYNNSARQLSRNQSDALNSQKINFQQFQQLTYLKSGDLSKNSNGNLKIQRIDSEDISDYNSSVLRSQSKANQLSDSNTPKFENSQLAQSRKKSHKDSFGGVDLGNIVYKDLSNPQRLAQQKNSKNKINSNYNALFPEKQNQSVFSERFQTEEMRSLTYCDDEKSSIQFQPYFKMYQRKQNGNMIPFQGFESHGKLIKIMKGSYIEKSPEFDYNQVDNETDLPKFMQKNSKSSQGNLLKPKNSGAKPLATSQIIQFSGNLEDKDYYQPQQMQQESDFLIIPSLNQRYQLTERNDNKQVLESQPHKDMFLSFSKNDRTKFIIPDQKQMLLNNSENKQIQPKNSLKYSMIEKKNGSVDLKLKNYCYRTRKQERQKYRQRQQLQQESSLSQKMHKQVTQINHSAHSTTKLQTQQHYNSDQSQNLVQNNNGDLSQIVNLKQFYSCKQNNSISRLQRKHSSNVPVHSPEQNSEKSKYPEINFSHSKQNVMKRFEQNPIRFSQILDNNDEETFYIKTKDYQRQSFGTKKPRKITDTYEGPLVHLNKGGNKTSQIIENDYTHKREHENQEQKFDGHLNVQQDKLSILINSGGGKNYSVFSNISYDEEKRLEDLLQMENQLMKKANNHAQERNNGNTSHFVDNQLDFANFQAVERLIFKKKQQKNKMSSHQFNVAIPNLNIKAQEPQNWVKKEVFYFFDTNSTCGKPSTKQVIMNPSRLPYNFNTEHHQRYETQRNRDLPGSSTSLYNYSPTKRLNPQIGIIEREVSLSDVSLNQRKSNTREMRPVSSTNFSPRADTRSQLNFPVSSHQNYQGLVKYINHNQRRNMFESPDQMSLYTQSPPVKPTQSKHSNASGKSFHNQSIRLQKTQSQLSKPVIRFIWGAPQNNFNS